MEVSPYTSLKAAHATYEPRDSSDGGERGQDPMMQLLRQRNENGVITPLGFES